MSQQINLFDPALLHKYELLTAAHLTIVAVALLLAMGGWGAWVRAQVRSLEAEQAAATPQLKALQDQVAATAKSLSEAKPDPQLESELATVRGLLALRGDIIAALKRSLGAESGGFAEYLRALARQTPRGLWLTGFVVDNGGTTMEIRGRMTDPALLPEYIRRLDGEKAFKGRAFAALKIETPQAASAGATAAAPAAATPAYLEFTLVPVRAEGAGEAGAAAQERKP